MPDSHIRDYLLDELSTIFAKSGSSIRDFNLPQKTSSSYSLSTNRLIDEELSYHFVQ